MAPAIEGPMLFGMSGMSGRATVAMLLVVVIRFVGAGAVVDFDFIFTLCWASFLGPASPPPKEIFRSSTIWLTTRYVPIIRMTAWTAMLSSRLPPLALR